MSDLKKSFKNKYMPHYQPYTNESVEFCTFIRLKVLTKPE